MEFLFALAIGVPILFVVIKLILNSGGKLSDAHISSAAESQRKSNDEVKAVELKSVWEQIEISALGGRGIVWKKDVGWQREGLAGYRFVFSEDKTLIVISLQGDSAYTSESVPTSADFKIDRIKIDESLDVQLKRTFLSLTSGRSESIGSFEGENSSSGIGLSIGGGVSANFSNGNFSGKTSNRSQSHTVGDEVLLEARLILFSGKSITPHEFKIRAAVGGIGFNGNIGHGGFYEEEHLLMSTNLTRYKKLFNSLLEDSDLEGLYLIEDDAEILDRIAIQLKQEAKNH